MEIEDDDEDEVEEEEDSTNLGVKEGFPVNKYMIINQTKLHCLRVHLEIPEKFIYQLSCILIFILYSFYIYFFDCSFYIYYWTGRCPAQNEQ